MSTYKVIQDIEAEDKLVGALTLRQFIYAGISAFFIYLSFFAVTKNVAFLLLFFAPPALLTGFLAIPWHGDQPTEVWALAKLRFYTKPRLRLWDQSGAKELVTITVPKQIQRTYTDGLNQTEVRSRLHALASTIDSRGWAVKNANLSVATTSSYGVTPSDRLADASILPQEVSDLDISASDDILDPTANPIAQHFDSMIATAATAQRQQLLQQMQQPSPAPALTQTGQISAPTPTSGQAQAAAPDDYWFMHQPTPVPGQATFATAPVVSPGTAPQAVAATPAAPVAATPTDEEEALLEKIKSANSSNTAVNDHLKHIKTPQELAEEARQNAVAAAAEASRVAAEKAAKAQVTSEKQAAIMNLASNDDLDVATLARQAKKQETHSDGEVVISLR